MIDPTLRETLDLLLRWLHVIAGIMWVGNSMLFNWLDRNLVRHKDAPDRMIGEIWLLHSGAYYQVEKKWLGPSEMPEKLHWFKWQSYTTWLSGIGLLLVVYYLGGKAFLVDPDLRDMSHSTAMLISISLLVGGWLIYDALWRLLGSRSKMLATALSLLLALAFTFAVSQIFVARAAYIHVGALFGTLMAGNVFMHIIPSQKQMVAATLAGEMADTALGVRAKTRSIHNNYLTFPVLFIMVSNHFPSTFGNTHNWLVLCLLVLGGAIARHLLNIRFHFKNWLPALFTTLVVTVGLLVLLIRPASSARSSSNPSRNDGQAVSMAFPVVKAIIDHRCVPCHAEKPADPTFGAAPAGGVRLDSPDRIQALAERIKIRAVDTKTMPMANKTGITDLERNMIGSWISEGAKINE